ncbi:hypothetical protein V8F33_011876 [Rhypophila sp. PSN 637]
MQELIAPGFVFFFDRDWDFIGDKADLCEDLGHITGIPSAVLTHWDSQASRCEFCYPGRRGFVRVGPDIEPCGHYREDILSKILDSCSVGQKLSWASRRETARIEDSAYCLLGLFGVNMPLLYGEGLRAFVRLQEEIIKISDDQSILAFERRGPEWPPFEGQDSLLAESPHYFAELGKVCMTAPAGTTFMTPTAKTLETQVWMCPLVYSPSMVSADMWLGILQCGYGSQNNANIALILEAVDPEHSIFCRVRSHTTVVVTPITSKVKVPDRHGVKDRSSKPLEYNVDKAVLTNIRLLLRSSKSKPLEKFIQRKAVCTSKPIILAMCRFSVPSRSQSTPAMILIRLAMPSRRA